MYYTVSFSGTRCNVILRHLVLTEVNTMNVEFLTFIKQNYEVLCYLVSWGLAL